MSLLLVNACRHAITAEERMQRVRDAMQRGQFDRAQREVDDAIAASRVKSPEWSARFTVVDARIAMMRGEYTESLRLLSPPLPPTLLNSDTEIEQKMVRSLDYDYLQQLNAADATLAQAELLAIETHSSLQGSLDQARGNLEMDRNNFAGAQAAFRKAASFGRDHNLPRVELGAFASLGFLAMNLERYDEAVDAFRATIEKSQEIGAADIEAKALGNLAWSYWVLGDFENAETELAAAGQKAAQLGLVEDQTYWLASLADVYSMQGRFAEADATGRRALALAETHDDKRTLFSCLNILTRVALSTGKEEEAAAFHRRAVSAETADSDPKLIANSRLLAGLIAAGKHDNSAALAAFQSVLADPKAETQEKWEAHARMAALFASQNQPGNAEREFDTAIRTVQAARSSIHSNELRVSFLTNAISFYDDYVNFLIAQKRPLDALKIADLSRSQTLDQSMSAPGKSETQAALLENPQKIARRWKATLLFYWLSNDKSWLWVINSEKTTLLPLAKSQNVNELVKSYRESFNDPRDPLQAGNPDGTELYETLIKPAENLIPPDGRVIVLPDGALNSLNFESLIVPGCSEPCADHKTAAKPHYWIEDATITIANSLALLARSSMSAPPKARNLLLMGEALPASPDFPPLAQAGREVELLEKYFPGEERLELTGKNATAGAFLRSAPENFSYLHFATHGTASRLRPLESAVILSPEHDSYKLYARDVVQHPLKAYLVTISACNGAGTKTYAGEGLVGLSWAFLRAGAHNVIAGLWEVSNASTPQLMDELYKGLTAGQDPATALRNAKLTLLRSTGNYRKPFYWAPFVLYAGS